MLRSSLFTLGMVLAVGSLTACEGDPDIETYSICSAGMSPIKWAYELAADGETLEIAPIVNLADGGMSMIYKLTREGNGTDLYDAWLLADQSANGVSVRTVFTFGMDDLTVTSTCQRLDEPEVTAEVMGRALYDATTIEILDRHVQQKRF